jgi:hypothetical protein
MWQLQGSKSPTSRVHTVCTYMFMFIHGCEFEQEHEHEHKDEEDKHELDIFMC